MMSRAAPSHRPILEQPPLPARRFTVEEYHRMGEAGILTEADRVELLEGWIVEKMIHRPPHDAVIELTDAALRAVLPPAWRVRIQSAITTEDSEPEPDLVVVSGPIRERLARHPQPAEIGLVVEVSETSLARDRAKARLYARAGIATYWIVNLVDSQVEVYYRPDQSAAIYQAETCYRRGDWVPVMIGGEQVGAFAVPDVLP